MVVAAGRPVLPGSMMIGMWPSGRRGGARLSGIDVAELTARWWRAWPCPPVGHLYRSYLPDRWVRLHSLPGSKRYPDTKAEYATVLYRHNTVLTELGAAAVYLITMRWPATDLAAGSEPAAVGLHPQATAWMRVPDPDDPQVSYDLLVSRTDYSPGSLDELLRYVADDLASGITIAEADLRWLYHPYDGGADVILPATADRDDLTYRHRDWLPQQQPSGL